MSLFSVVWDLEIGVVYKDVMEVKKMKSRYVGYWNGVVAVECGFEFKLYV